MRYTIIWNKQATDGLNRLRQRDGSGVVKPLLNAINALATDPEPSNSTKCGRERRLRVGRYRALYEVDGHTIAVKILMVGSTAT